MLSPTPYPVTVPTPLPATLSGITTDEGLLGVMPYDQAVAEGVIPGHTQFAQFGYTPTVNTTNSDVWLGTGVYVWPATAQQMELVSTSTQDSAVGTGLRTITIQYLDASYTAHLETDTMAGVIPVHTVATNIFRVNNIWATTVGSTYAAVGTISLQNLAGTTVYRYIEPTYTASRGSIYTVPTGQTLFIEDFYTGFGELTATETIRATLRATFNLYTQTLLVPNMFMPIAEVLNNNGSTDRIFNVAIVCPSDTDLKISVQSDGGSGNCEASIRGWLQPN
jgi:hypothetical protein